MMGEMMTLPMMRTIMRVKARMITGSDVREKCAEMGR